MPLELSLRCSIDNPGERFTEARLVVVNKFVPGNHYGPIDQIPLGSWRRKSEQRTTAKEKVVTGLA